MRGEGGGSKERKVAEGEEGELVGAERGGRWGRGEDNWREETSGRQMTEEGTEGK